MQLLRSSQKGARRAARLRMLAASPEMEEMSKELDGPRAKVEVLTAQLRGLKRVGADQAARLRDAWAEPERHVVEALTV